MVRAWKPWVWVITALFAVAVAQAAGDLLGDAVADMDNTRECREDGC